NLIRQLADAGTAIVVVSSEIEEVLGLSDRVLVIAEGQLLTTVDADQIDEHGVLDLVMQGTAAGASRPRPPRPPRPASTARAPSAAPSAGRRVATSGSSSPSSSSCWSGGSPPRSAS